jgi:hypothetical protein
MRGFGKKPGYRCEVCNSPGVVRRGVWDYCPKGHTYVGQRAEVRDGDLT